MVIVNFYKKHKTSWEELQMLALDTIALFEEEVEEIEVGSLSVEQQYEDYRNACIQGMKTFILQVINEWGEEHILLYNDNFYKRFEVLEMDGILKSYQFPNLYRNQKELFKLFKGENIQLLPENFDFIHETFTEDVVCNVSSFEFEIREIDEDNDFLSNNGFDDFIG